MAVACHLQAPELCGYAVSIWRCRRCCCWRRDDAIAAVRRLPGPCCVARLRVTRNPGGRLGQRTPVAYLEVPGSEGLILHNVKLVSWHDPGLVLTAVEHSWRRLVWQEFRQSWWCRIDDSEAEGQTVKRPVHELDLVG